MEVLADTVFTTFEELSSGIMVSDACGCLIGVPPGGEILPVFIHALFRHFWAGQLVRFSLLTGTGACENQCAFKSAMV